MCNFIKKQVLIIVLSGFLLYEVIGENSARNELDDDNDIGEQGEDGDEQTTENNCIQIDMLNFTCPLENLRFYLYTRDTQNEPFQIDPKNIEKVPFVPLKPLKILIHGYTGWKDYSPNEEIRPAYFEHGEYNIISLDWNPLAREGCYVEATYNVISVGTCTAKLIDEISDKRSDVIQRDDIHVIGFSLGAHVAGFVGRSTTKKLKRITALDPAFPLFDFLFNGDFTVTHGDAEFMDVVHTNVGLKGKAGSLGHVDFYMNGAVYQPGCGKMDTSCNHRRAVKYFAESITTEIGFWGYACSSVWTYLSRFCKTSPTNEWVLMGEYVNHSSTGNYFIQTNEEPPYAKGKYEVINETNGTDTEAAESNVHHPQKIKQTKEKTKHYFSRNNYAFFKNPNKINHYH